MVLLGEQGQVGGGGEALPRADLPSPYHLPVWAYPPILPTP